MQPVAWRLRDATVADVPVIRALIEALADYERLRHECLATDEQLRTHLFGPDPVARVTLVDTDDGVMGMALWWRTFSTFLTRPGIWLEDLFVRPEARGRGYGLALLQHLRGLTDARVEWNVLDWNEPSIRFYEALGARPLQGWTQYRWLP
jgi:GNAT superfamily N-acetyltransferase